MLSARSTDMYLLWFLTFIGAACAQSNTTDACFDTCFSASCGANFVNNLTCMCNTTIYQAIQMCLTGNCIQNDFSAAEQLEYQYCGGASSFETIFNL